MEKAYLFLNPSNPLKNNEIFYCGDRTPQEKRELWEKWKSRPPEGGS
jgi:hypothetical protein